MNVHALASANRLVMSVPSDFGRMLADASPGILSTYETLLSLFRRARQCVKVFSPYVDPTFTSLMQAARCPVRIITTCPDARRSRGNPVLERCSSFRNVSVKYMIERRGGHHLFQMHAKMVLADASAAYIGSANLTDTSLHYNLELGIYTTERPLLFTLDRVFNFLFTQIAVSEPRR
jgi:phosphatidylserine/phosphatidylglycerophosphate/cardiolipin synthase-like enzyme